MKHLFLIIFSFFTHLSLIKLGNDFTSFFGYASVVWPVTGVILGLYFLFGWPVIVGAFFSSLVNIYLVNYFPDMSSNVSLLLALTNIGQIILTRYLISRFFDLPININKASLIIKFIVTTGPVMALVTAAVFFVSLWLITNLNIELLLYLTMIKWCGEFVGITFLTPTFFFFYSNKFVKPKKRATVAIFCSGVCYFLVTVLFLVVTNLTLKEKQQHFIKTTQPFIEQFNITQTQIKHHIKALDGFFGSSLLVSRDEFKKFTNKIRSLDTKISALAWLPYIHDYERNSFEQAMLEEGIKNAKIKQLVNDRVVTASRQTSYIPIYYIEPMTVNQVAIGLDVSTHPIVSSSAIKAAMTKDYVLAPFLSLLQSTRKTGMIVYYPIFTVDESGNEDLKGLIEASFEIDVLLSDIYEQLGHGEFSYKLTYGDNNTYQQQSFNEDSILSYALDTKIFDKSAHLSFASTKTLESELINWSHLSIMIAGSIIGIIFVMFVFFIISFNSSLTRKINEGTAKLTLKNQELEDANKAKNLFLANISHEYRTPLNAIIGFAEIAQRETSDVVAKSYLSKIDNASNILLSIVNDVLDLSKMQAGELRLEHMAFQPAVVTASVVEMLNEKAQEKEIDLSFDFDKSFEYYLAGDELRFKQIIINLLTNAIKFTSKGGVKVWGKCVDNLDSTYTLTLIVSDSGIGIKPEDKKRLFSSFAQAEDSTTRQYGGTGLGLSIVKQLCELMNGNILLDSKLGKGSEFTVTLQFEKTDQSSISAQNKASAVTTTNIEDINFHNMSVLVVEDNKINQVIVEKQLSSLFVNCEFADNGQLALDYLALSAKTDSMPDLILMDLQMPVMDGFSAAEKIKQNLNLQHIPIVILSASVGKEERDKAAKLGIYDFIYKPFKQEDLFHILTKYAAK